jgi:hypothetical protein
MHSTKSIWFAILLTACAGADDELGARGLLHPGVIEVPSEDPIAIPGEDLEPAADAGTEHTGSDAGESDAGSQHTGADAATADASTHTASDAGSADAGRDAGQDAGHTASDAGHAVSDASTGTPDAQTDAGPAHTVFETTEEQAPDNVRDGLEEWENFPPAERAHDLGSVPSSGRVLLHGLADHKDDVDYFSFTIATTASDVYLNVFPWLTMLDKGTRIPGGTVGGADLAIDIQSSCFCPDDRNYCHPPFSGSSESGPGLFVECASPTIFVIVRQMIPYLSRFNAVQYEIGLDIVPAATRPAVDPLVR